MSNIIKLSFILMKLFNKFFKAFKFPSFYKKLLKKIKWPFYFTLCLRSFHLTSNGLYSIMTAKLKKTRIPLYYILYAPPLKLQTELHYLLVSLLVHHQFKKYLFNLLLKFN